MRPARFVEASSRPVHPRRGLAVPGHGQTRSAPRARTGVEGGSVMRTRTLFVRILIAAVAISLWFGTQSLIATKTPPATGVGDSLHVLTAPLNQYLHQHPERANVL